MTPPDNDAPAPFESPYRLAPENWSALVTELKADKPPTKGRSRSPKGKAPTSSPGEFAQDGGRSAWEIALELAGRLGRPLGDGRFAVLCPNDAQHSNPDRTAEGAQGSCVLLPPARDSIFGLPKCSHAHCQALTLRQWIAAVTFDHWAEAMVRARGWRRAREFLLHDGGISGWKRIPFLLRDQEDTVEGGPYQVVPDDTEYAINFHALITSDVKLHGADGVRRWYDLEAVVSGVPARFRVPASDFNSMAWVANELGSEAIIQAGRDTIQKLRVGIQFLSMPVPRRDIYATTGWRKINGEEVYLHAGGAVGARGATSDVSVQLPGDAAARFVFPAPPEGEALRAAVRACLALFRVGASTVAIPLFGAVWRAALGPSPLTIYLAAQPGAGKSLLAALAQQHYGAGMHEAALPASVKHSTAASVNALRALVGDAVFVLDDFMVSGTADDLKLNEKIDSVVRAQYGGTGAQRLQRDGSLSTNAAPPPRSTLILTGETLPRGGSLRQRLLVLELPGRMEQDLAPMKTLAAQGVYAGAMAAYLRWLAPQMDVVRAELRDLVASAAARLRADAKDGDRDHRTAFLLAEVDVGVRFFCRFAAHVDEGLGGELEVLRQRTRVALGEMTSTQHAHRAAQDPAARFLELLAAALSGGCCHVALDDGTAPEHATAWGWRVAGSSPTSENEESEQMEAFDDHPAPEPPAAARARRIIYRGGGDCVGVVHAHEGLVWIKPEIAMKAVRALASTSGDPLALTTEDLPRRLFEKGFLAKDDFKTNRAYAVRGPKEAKFGRGYLCLKTSTLFPEDAPAGAPAGSTGSTGSAAPGGADSRIP